MKTVEKVVMNKLFYATFTIMVVLGQREFSALKSVGF